MKLDKFRVHFGGVGKWNERRWAMQKTRRVASAVAGCALALGVLGAVSAAHAAQPKLPTSDKPAAILVWPKIVVDTSDQLATSNGPTDTLIQLSSAVPISAVHNASVGFGVKQAHCFYVNATGHCSNSPSTGCQSFEDCTIAGPAGDITGSCDPGWSETDFDIRITPEQPLAWLASEGLRNLPLPNPGFCSNDNRIVCTTDDRCGGFHCVLGASNSGSGIPPVAEDPFMGSLTCIEFDPTTNPAQPDTSPTANSIFGNAAIEVVLDGTDGHVDVQKYNAIGIQKLCNDAGTDCTQGAPVTDVLQLDGVIYQGCPARLVLNHLFDGSDDPMGADNGTVSTDLTLVPCGNDFLSQIPGQVTAQFLVFNEFEQRFSTSANVDCFFEKELSNIDTPNASNSIFSRNVEGTLAGQTIIRGVGSAATGNGLLGVAREFVGVNGAAYNLNEKAVSTTADIITIP
jgi:hypothetical protein